MTTLSSDYSHVNRFHANIIALSDLIYDIVLDASKRGYETVSPTLVSLGRMALETFDRKWTIDGFIQHGHEHWDNIRNRNESFFEENAGNIFNGLPMNNVDAFKKLFTLKDEAGNFVVPQEDRESVWKFIECMIIICIKYVHEMREPFTRKGEDGKIRKFYARGNFFEEITNLNHHAKIWNIKLEWPDPNSE